MESEVLYVTSNNISNSLNQSQFVLIFDIWRILHGRTDTKFILLAMKTCNIIGAFQCIYCHSYTVVYC